MCSKTSRFALLHLMHSLTDAKKQPLLSCERDFPDHHQVRTLDPLCLVAVFLSRCCRSSEIHRRSPVSEEEIREPEITELAIGSKQPGNLNSVALQSSGSHNLQSEAEHSHRFNESVRAYNAVVFYCGRVNILYEFSNFLAVLPTINDEQNQASLTLMQMEPRKNIEREGSSGHPVKGDEPTESSAKSVLADATRSKRTKLRCSIISEKPTDVILKSDIVLTRRGRM
jgi:hypothetical protein